MAATLYLSALFVLFLILSGCSTLKKEEEKDLQLLLGKLPDNAVVKIPKGNYIANLPVIIKARHGLTLIWEQNSTLTAVSSDMPLILIESSTGITIKNISLNYASSELPEKCNMDGTSMVHIRNSSEILIDNCELNGGVSIGIGAFKTDGFTINRSEIRKFSAAAFRIEQCGTVQILQSLIEKNGSFMKAGTIGNLIMSDNLERKNGGYYTKGKSIPAPGTIKKQTTSLEEIH
jgi:hypothetical protein